MNNAVVFVVSAAIALTVGASCSSEQAADGGRPRCPAGTQACGNGVCANTLSDVNNCGVCGNACTPGQNCSDGSCVGGSSAGSTGGGAATGGGSGAGGDGAGGSGATTSVTCTMSVNSELSPMIQTVGIVTWSTDLAGVDSAYIEFGPDENYGMQAPVDLSEPEYRTLLLGMTPSSDYHFRVVAVSGSSACISDDYSITTGAVATDISEPTVTTMSASEVAPGFLVTARFVNSGGDESEGQMYIYNQDGKLVWWYTPSISGISRAAMTYDGKYMIARDVNADGAAPGQIVKVSMDGLQEEPIAIQSGHHDFAVTPDNGVVYIRKAPDNCDELVKVSESGEETVIYTVSDAFGGNVGGGNDPCHTNAIHYNADDDTFTFSALMLNSFVKISSSGTLIWVLGGDASQFSGDGADWDRQHGHHMLAPDRILFFNNGSLGGPGSGGGGSLALEVLLDLDSMTATRVWDYDGNNSSQNLGDVQRLPNGNTLVTYSNAGVVHEVNSDRQLIQEMTWRTGGAIGYVNHRPTLYGPPPR